MIDLFFEYGLPIIYIVAKILLITLPLLLCVAYLTYAERRVIGLMQMRRGPNVVGPFGLLQPIADAVKLIFKEVIVPTPASKVVFILAPMITFTLSLIGWAVIPFGAGMVLADINVGVLYILVISSLGVYGIIMAGWASNSKYAFLGAIRSSAQMISYEVSMGLVIVTVLLVTGTLNMSEIVEYQRTMPLWIQLLLAPMAVVFFISVPAETNRLPFDLPEAEAELVAGYNVEYSSMAFALFFLGSCWHGGGGNVSNETRYGVTYQWNLAWLRQEENQYLSTLPEIAKHFPRSLTKLIGYDVANASLGYYGNIRHPSTVFNSKRAINWASSSSKSTSKL